MWSLLKLLVLMVLAPAVHPDPSQDVVGCYVASKIFARSEGKYIDKRKHPEDEPNLAGPELEELQKKVYSIEKRQRPFECIGNRTDDSSIVLLKLNPKYQALVKSCKRKQYQPICNPSYKYRTINGTCNNLAHPKWGSVLSCLQRLFTPRYEGVSGFRQSVCGGPLPEPRTITLRILTDRNRPSKDVTHITLFLGQFVAHDLSDIATTFVSTKPIDCCSHPGKNQHPQCAPIILSRNDYFYSKFNVTCFDFVRGALCDTCDIGKRNQMIQATSYIDLSQVYGLSDKLARSLRSKDGKGKLESQYKNGEELLPPDHSLDDLGGCGSGTDQETCFLAGDRRVNMHAPLMSLHTVFQREHNRLAEQLSKLNPYWDDETLYQEARKINIAQMQVIIYKELLPIFIGPKLMTLYGLSVTGQSLYDASVETTLKAEFNGAAYRLHSGLNGIATEHGCTEHKQYLRNLFQDAEPLYKGNIACLMRGICQSPAQQYDKYVTHDMTDFLYRAPKGSYGFDIVSVNIQRGRDIGLPTYTEMVRFLSGGNTDIQTFEQLSSLMDECNIKALKETYSDVRDIDLWVGMNNEKVHDNMFVGPTAGDIIARQFSDLKKGDRFFFQHFGNFNYQQLTALKQASFASIMCKNTKLQSIQQNALRFPSFSNPVLHCKDIPKVDLRFWAKSEF